MVDFVVDGFAGFEFAREDYEVCGCGGEGLGGAAEGWGGCYVVQGCFYGGHVVGWLWGVLLSQIPRFLRSWRRFGMLNMVQCWMLMAERWYLRVEGAIRILLLPQHTSPACVDMAPP